MFMSDWSALMTPQKAAPGQDAYTFVIRILSTSFTSVSIFSVWCCSRYLSLWTKRLRQKSVIKGGVGVGEGWGEGWNYL